MTVPGDTDATLELPTPHSPPQSGLGLKKAISPSYRPVKCQDNNWEKKLTYTKGKYQGVSGCFPLCPALLAHAAESKLQHLCASEKHN